MTWSIFASLEADIPTEVGVATGSPPPTPVANARAENSKDDNWKLLGVPERVSVRKGGDGMGPIHVG